MTLHVEPPPPAADGVGKLDLPALVVRFNKPPRVPLWYWFRYPRRALWITMLIRESFRWRELPNASPNALTWAENALFERARLAREKAVAGVVDKIERLADRYQALRAEAARERALAAAARKQRHIPKIKTPVYVAGPTTVDQAEKTIERCRQRIAADTERGQTRHQEHSSGARRAVSVVPLLVDIVALLTVIAKFFNVTPANALQKLPETITAIGFALLASLVLALLAHSAGHAAWHLRATGGAQPEPPSTDGPEPTPSDGEPGREFPSAKFLLYGKLISLFAVSLMVAVSVATRVMHPTADVSTGPTGVVIGLLLGLAAFLAPWVIVLNLMRSGSLEVRTIEALTTMLQDAEAAVTGHEKAAAQAEEQATLVRQSAERDNSNSLRPTIEMAELARQIVKLARSQHGQAGRYALSENGPAAEPYTTMRDVLAVDTSAIDEAMKRFTDEEEPPHPAKDDHPQQ